MEERRPEPRLVTVSRRRFLLHGAVGGAMVLVPGLACGNNDEDVLGGAGAPQTEPRSRRDDVSGALEQGSTMPADDPIDTTETTAGTAVPRQPATGEMLVSFTYTPDGTGKRENPYIAVWVETPDGDLVDTVALWYEQSDEGDKWLDDLRRWYDASDEGDDVSMSAATRAAGSFTVTWDLTDLTGQPVNEGDYVLFVESARENGPLHITSTPMRLGTGVGIDLDPDGELTGVSVDWS